MLTSSATIAIKSLQIQLKDLKAENEHLKTQVVKLTSETLSKTSFFSSQVDSIQLIKKNKEEEMKADIIFLCEKVRQLENENRIVKEANEKLQKKSQNNEKTFEKFYATQRIFGQSSIESAQKDAEIDFLKKKVQRLEASLSKESFPQMKSNELLNSSKSVLGAWRNKTFNY